MATATKELATIDQDGEVELLTKTKAKALDKKVRTARDRVVGDGDKLYTDMEALYNLVLEALRGQIHKALGISWAAWVKDAAQIPKLDRPERKEVAVKLSGKGLSLRTLEGVLGWDKHTISNDLAEAQADGEYTPPDAITGLDNKTYTRADDEPIDAEYEEIEGDEETAESEEAETPPATAAELVTDFADEFTNFWNGLVQMHDIVAQEPKWPGAKKRVVKAHLNDLQEAKVTLEIVIDALMAD